MKNKKRSITGEERNKVTGEEVKENVKATNDDAAGQAAAAESTPPVKKARGRRKSRVPPVEEPIQVTPMVDEVTDIADAEDPVVDEVLVDGAAQNDDGDAVESIESRPDEAVQDAQVPEAPPAEKEVKLKREVNIKQQVREESYQQEEGGYYEVLTANEYLGVDPAQVKSSLTFWCKCPMPPKGQSGCLAECENRAKRVECDLPLCKAGDQCSNRVIQNNTSLKLAITEGFGESIVVATEDVSSGVYLGQYTGQVVAKQGLEEKINKEYTKQQKLHVLPLNQELVVDATAKGSICRLACHSCAPNTEVVAWKVEGLDCLAMYSIKDIKANESVTFDQSPQNQLLKTSKRCNCGARSCHKILGGFAHAQGPLACGVCLNKVVEDGVTGQVWLHPDLATPLCGECLDQYKQVDWAWKLMTTKTPGKEGACRWCTKTGKMVNCSDCTKSFCKKCLKVNLGANYIKLAETGSWTCLVCDTRPLDKIRAVLWADGEAATKVAKPVADATPNGVVNLNPGVSSPGAPRMIRPPGRGPNSPGLRGSPLAGPRGSPGPIPRPVGGSRHPRPSTPRGSMGYRFPGPRGNSPRMGTPTGLTRPGGQRFGTPFPLRQPAVSPRLLGQSNVTIEKVAKPAPVQAVQQARSGQTEAIINQLQRYSGLSIQPISESVSHLDGIVKEVESAYRLLQETVNDAKRMAKDEGIMKTKERIGEGVRAAKAKLGYVESRL